MATDCAGQLRVAGMGLPFALDFGAVMTVGAARGVDLALLSDVLPSIETAILTGRDEPDNEGE